MSQRPAERSGAFEKLRASNFDDLVVAVERPAEVGVGAPRGGGVGSGGEINARALGEEAAIAHVEIAFRRQSLGQQRELMVMGGKESPGAHLRMQILERSPGQ